MRRSELAVADADLAPRLDELPVRREFADARRRSMGDACSDILGGNHALRVMAVRDVDVTVGSDDDGIWLVELAVGVAGFTRDAQAHQLLTLRAELVHLMPFCAVLVSRKIGHPHVALLVYGEAVRGYHHALSEVREHGAGPAVDFEDRIDRGVVAVDRTAASRTRAAAFVGPDVPVRRIYVDAGRCAPFAARRELTPVSGHYWGWVRQSIARDRIPCARAPRVRRLGESASVQIVRGQENRGTNGESGPRNSGQRHSRLLHSA